jgi:hypothetical protein
VDINWIYIRTFNFRAQQAVELALAGLEEVFGGSDALANIRAHSPEHRQTNEVRGVVGGKE